MSTLYTTTIGLEVHAELATKSKMFCGCKNDPHAGEPNAHTCPICLAHPGTLPAPNEEAIAKVLMFGQAINATRANFSEFDRKNYFYPDIPKAYQISQYAYPLLTGGELAGVKLTRIHLEEDTARSQHEHDGVSLIDFNRAGVPLMELVTEPVIHDAKTAGDFARELQLLLKTLQISQAQMERGEMRVEANISVSKTDVLGTKVEVKNLNSFKSVESAIEYEVMRQIALLEKGGSVKQETMGWDEVKQKTYSQRAKETAKDYRYFPDPDIPKLQLEKHPYFSKNRLAEIIPETPDKKRLKYRTLGLPSNQTELIISTEQIRNIFEELFVVQKLEIESLRLAANYLTSDVLAYIATNKPINVSGQHFGQLMNLVQKGTLNSRIAKDILVEILETDADPEQLAHERGLVQSSDPAILKSIITEVMLENPGVVTDYKSGKQVVLQFLVGQGMKKTKGAANPELLASLFKEALLV